MISQSHNWPSHELPFFKLSNRHSLFFPWYFYLALFPRILSRRLLPLRDKVNVNGFFATANPSVFLLCLSGLLSSLSLCRGRRFTSARISGLWRKSDERKGGSRHISHFSDTAWRTRFSASPSWNSHGRMALKSLSRHSSKGWFCKVEFTHKLNKKRKGFS